MTTAVMKNKKAELARGTEHRNTVVPKYRIQEKEDRFEITLVLPGVAENALNIDLEERLLKIVGESGSYRFEGFEIAHREFSQTTYEVSFKLPLGIEEDKVKADLNDGVLVLTLPKAVQSLTRKISVNAQ